MLRWRERKMDSILRLELPVDLPHIIIDARANEQARRSNLTAHDGADSKSQFEGASGSHYDAYTVEGGEAAAFQVFTPDVPEVLYTRLPTTDIEIEGRYLWLVQRYTVVNDKSAGALFEAAQDLYRQIAYNARVM